MLKPEPVAGHVRPDQGGEPAGGQREDDLTGRLHRNGQGQATLLDISTDDAIAQLFVTKFSTISLCFTKLYVT